MTVALDRYNRASTIASSRSKNMAIIGGTLGYQILRRLTPRDIATVSQSAKSTDTRLRHHFGSDFLDLIQGKTVIDFGCGPGLEAVEMAKSGAARIVGLDIQPRLLAQAQSWADQHSLGSRCAFAMSTTERADIIVSKDAFEHFSDPAAILRSMAAMLKPNGLILASFGPTWLHPYGGHLFSVFPWAHLVFTERALIRWRAEFKSDGATRFSEVEGGLNRMTIGRFERLVAMSPCKMDSMDTVPIRGIRAFAHPVLREFGSSIVRCRLTVR